MKLKANLPQFSLVIRRHVTIFGPETKLFAAVICQAYSDILAPMQTGKTRKVDGEAVRFFFDGRLDLFAEHIGINPDFVREMLCRAAPGIEGLV